MRKLLFIFLLLPLRMLGQYAVTYVDTVTVSGYFYCFLGHKGRIKNWEGVYADDDYFVSDSALAGKTILQFLRYVHDKEADCEKFLTQLPSWESGPFKEADTATLIRLNQVIEVRPFIVGRRSRKIGVGRTEAAVTRVTVRWMRLRAEHDVALGGFNNPQSLDVVYVKQAKWTYVYLPLEVLAMQRHITWRVRKKGGTKK